MDVVINLARGRDVDVQELHHRVEPSGDLVEREEEISGEDVDEDYPDFSLHLLG